MRRAARKCSLVVAALAIVAVLAVSLEPPVVRAGDVDSATPALQPTIDGALCVLAEKTHSTG